MEAFESVDTWIARQEWSADIKSAAIEVARARDARGLNPMTRAEWRSWYARQELAAAS